MLNGVPSYVPSLTSGKACFMFRVGAWRCCFSQLCLSNMDICVADSMASRQTAHIEVQGRNGRALGSHKQSLLKKKVKVSYRY